VGRRAYERQAFVRSRAARRLRDAGSTFGARRSRGAYRRGEGRLLVRHDPARHHHASRVYEMSTSATNRRPCAATPGATSVPAASTDRDRRVIRMPAGRRLHRLTVECGTCRDQPLARHAPSSMRRPPTSRYPSSGGRGSPRLRSPRLPRDLSCADDLRCRRSSERFRSAGMSRSHTFPGIPGEIVGGASRRDARPR